MTRLKEMRIKSGLTQKQLAEKSDLKLAVLQHYEQGNRNFDGAKLDTIIKVCIALDCKIQDIIEDSCTITLLNRYLRRSE